MRSSVAVVLFCTLLVIGYKFAIQSWDGIVYVYLGQERAPAAVRSMSDYSAVKRRAIGASVHEQIMSEAESEKRNGQVGIHLGNPLIRTHSGNEFGCRFPGREGVYDRIELTFVGTGISVSGDNAEMIVEAPCESGGDATVLNPIWIPLKEILARPAEDISIPAAIENGTNIQLRHLAGEWPPQWVLSKVKLYRNDDGEYFLEVSSEKMRFARSSMLSIDSEVGN